MEGEYLDAITASGLNDVEVVSTKDVFTGAEGEERANSFETM